MNEVLAELLVRLVHLLQMAPVLLDLLLLQLVHRVHVLNQDQLLLLLELTNRLQPAHLSL